MQESWDILQVRQPDKEDVGARLYHRDGLVDYIRREFVAVHWCAAKCELAICDLLTQIIEQVEAPHRWLYP